MEKTATIRIDFDKKCSRCGKPGATQNGLCLSCITRAIKNGEYDHIFKRIREKMQGGAAQ